MMEAEVKKTRAMITIHPEMTFDRDVLPPACRFTALLEKDPLTG